MFWRLLILNFACLTSYAAGPTLADTIADRDFTCESPKGPAFVGGDYDVCADRVVCKSKSAQKDRNYFVTCRSDGGKCPKFDVCGVPGKLEKSKSVYSKNEKLAEAGPEDKKEKDRYGRKCSYANGGIPRSVWYEFKPGEVTGFCATPINCEGGGSDAPDLPVAACEPSDMVEEKGKPLPTMFCPRVNTCIAKSLKVDKAEMALTLPRIRGTQLVRRRRNAAPPIDSFASLPERSTPFSRGVKAPGHM